VAKHGNELLIEFFYVGKGDCTLIHFPGGRKYAVIDSHKPSWLDKSPIIKRLQEIVELKRDSDCSEVEITFVCASHPHFDHVYGLEEVFGVKGVTVEEFWHTLPNVEKYLIDYKKQNYDSRDPYHDIAKLCQNDHIGEFLNLVKKANKVLGNENIKSLQGISIQSDIEGVEIYVLNPTEKAVGRYTHKLLDKYRIFSSRNRAELDNISVALLFVYGENSVLYASDMQGNQWAEVFGNIAKTQIINHYFPVNALKASHHGGPMSFYPGLWNDAFGSNGGDVIVSGGDREHPSEQFIESIQKTGKRIYCTGHGNYCAKKMSLDSQDYFDSLMNIYGASGKKSFHPCCNDIKLTIPKTGIPTIEHTEELRTCHKAG